MCGNEALGFYYFILIIHFDLCIIIIFYVFNTVCLLLKYSRIQPTKPINFDFSAQLEWMKISKSLGLHMKTSVTCCNR